MLRATPRKLCISIDGRGQSVAKYSGISGGPIPSDFGNGPNSDPAPHGHDHFFGPIALAGPVRLVSRRQGLRSLTSRGNWWPSANRELEQAFLPHVIDCIETHSRLVATDHESAARIAPRDIMRSLITAGFPAAGSQPLRAAVITMRTRSAAFRAPSFFMILAR
jgi:hypothetical protein